MARIVKDRIKSVLERLENPPKKTTDCQQQRTAKNKDREAR